MPNILKIFQEILGEDLDGFFLRDLLGLQSIG